MNDLLVFSLSYLYTIYGLSCIVLALLSLLNSHIDEINPDFSWIKDWKNPFKPQDAGLLSQRGMLEHYNLSKRIVKAFPDLLNTHYNPIEFSFRQTRVSRAAMSASAFAMGMFEGKGELGENKLAPIDIVNESEELDFSLRYFFCSNTSSYYQTGIES